MKVFLIIALMGYSEGLLLKRANGTGRKIFFNHFSFYHLILLLQFITINYFFDTEAWPIIFLYILVQDIFSHLGSRQLPTKHDWINWPFHWQLFGFIPWIYPVLLMAYLLLRRLF